MVNVARRHKLSAAGIFSSAEIVEGIFNSKGVNDWYEQTLAEVSVSMLDSSSSGWQKANSPDVAQLNPVQMAEVAAQKAIESRNPRDLPPGKYVGDSGAGCGAGHCGIHVLGFRRLSPA